MRVCYSYASKIRGEYIEAQKKAKQSRLAQKQIEISRLKRQIDSDTKKLDLYMKRLAETDQLGEDFFLAVSIKKLLPSIKKSYEDLLFRLDPRSREYFSIWTKYIIFKSDSPKIEDSLKSAKQSVKFKNPQ